jgi:trans-aconitate 2-methyltransferase
VPTRDWNAHSYDSVSAPQQEWGAAVTARLELRGDETVLDAGAGTGRVSEMVLERLPRGHLIAVDGSQSMAQRARERLPADRASVICCDLLALELPEPVDAVISTATFHWILDHDALLRRMRALLRDGGQFVVQCGGEGNIARVRAIGAALAAQTPYREHLAALGQVWNYAGVEETRERLDRAGFEVSACWLAPARPSSAAAAARVPRDGHLRALPRAPPARASRPVPRRRARATGRAGGARLSAAELGRAGALSTAAGNSPIRIDVCHRLGR